MKRRKKLPFYEAVEIKDIGADGKAVAKINELVIFVPLVVPGDVVDVQVIKKKRNYQEGYAVKFRSYSEKRVEAICRHYGICGGCKWQCLPYEDQLHYKQKQVVDHLERIGKISTETILPIIPSENTVYYRNKLEFTFSNKRWLAREEMDIPDEEKQLNGLGFHIPGKFDKVMHIQKCMLQPFPSNEIRLAVLHYAIENKLTFFDLRAKTGFLRNIIIRSTLAGEVMVILVFFHEAEKERVALLNHVKALFPQISAMHYVINPKHNDTIYDLDVHVHCGSDHLVETIGEKKFKIGPKSFFQTNPIQTRKLYQVVLDYTNLTGNEIVYDLYTGTGTIACYIADHAAKVIGIESIPEAIEDAKENAALNGINNCFFHVGDMKDVFTQDFIAANGYPDVVILDPPRAGLHTKVINSLLLSNIKSIVYVSCNPATQARDVNLLSEKYCVIHIQPVDMFPHTHHVENVILLRVK